MCQVPPVVVGSVDALRYLGPRPPLAVGDVIARGSCGTEVWILAGVIRGRALVRVNQCELGTKNLA